MKRDVAEGFGEENSKAFQQVLDAEGAAERRLQNARQDASQLVAAALDRAELIRKRADERISRLHIAMERRIEDELNRMRLDFNELEGSAPSNPQFSINPDALARAVRRLAAKLTGQADEADR